MTAPPSPGLTRRRLLVAGGAALAGSGAFPLTSVAARARRSPLARAGRFGSGVAAGLPTERGALLWTRLDELGERTAPGRERLRWEVADDPGFGRVLLDGVVDASSLRDGTARVQVASPRLEPGRPYWYRFATRTTSSRIGRFTTLRPADSAEPVRIAFFSCQRYEHGWFTPQALLARDDVDLVVSLGDYLYEEDATPISPERRDTSGLPNGHVETLAQFRARHRTYRSDERLQDMHAAHAVVSIWDDCEVEGNWAGEGPSSGPSPVGERAVPFAEKRRNGILAYFEWMPVPRPRGVDRFKVYRSLRLGRHAELFLLDTRQYRDPQPCGDVSFDSGPPCATVDAPRKRLGDAQKAWLKDRVPASDATWKVLGNAQMMMALDVAPGLPSQVDDWAGYGAERREVLEHFRARGVRNLTSIVGDVHSYFAGDLHTTGRIDGRRVGTEFVGASVSHRSLTLPGLSKEQSDLITGNLTLTNPHLRFADFRRHGYAVLEARAQELRVDFKGVSTVRSPTADPVAVASFRVADGRPVVERTA